MNLSTIILCSSLTTVSFAAAFTSGQWCSRRIKELFPDEEDRTFPNVCYWIAHQSLHSRSREFFGWTLLHKAAMENRVGIVKACLHSGAQVNVRSYGNNWASPLHCAAAKGNIEAMRVLLDNGADIDIFDRTSYEGYGGETPLHKAVRTKRKEAVCFLVERGANKALCNHQGLTPYELAIGAFSLEIARLLTLMGPEEGIDNRSVLRETPPSYEGAEGGLTNDGSVGFPPPRYSPPVELPSYEEI